MQERPWIELVPQGREAVKTSFPCAAADASALSTYSQGLWPLALVLLSLSTGSLPLYSLWDSTERCSPGQGQRGLLHCTFSASQAFRIYPVAKKGRCHLSGLVAAAERADCCHGEASLGQAAVAQV